MLSRLIGGVLLVSVVAIAGRVWWLSRADNAQGTLTTDVIAIETASVVPPPDSAAASSDPLPVIINPDVPDDPLPVGDFDANRAQLEALARAGRADAAYRLGDVLRQCQYHEWQDPDVVLDRMIEHGARPVEDAEDAASIARRTQQTVAHVVARNALCDGAVGLESADSKDSYRWLVLAAELGHPVAMATRFDIEFAHHFSRNMQIDRAHELLALKPRAQAMLRRAEAMGEPAALFRLARAHASGDLAERDPIRARAYELAALNVRARAGNADALVTDPQIFLGGLDAAQQEHARVLSQQILARCCR